MDQEEVYQGQVVDINQIIQTQIENNREKDFQELISNPKRTLTEYEKLSIESELKARKLEIILNTWGVLKRYNLSDEVDDCKLNKVFVQKISSIINKI